MPDETDFTALGELLECLKDSKDEADWLKHQDEMREYEYNAEMSGKGFFEP